MLWILIKEEWMLNIEIYKSEAYLRQLSPINQSWDSWKKLQHNYHLIPWKNVPLWNEFRWVDDISIIIKRKTIKIEMGTDFIRKWIVQK